MANKIGSRILKVHYKSYEGDLHGSDLYQTVSLWDTESNNNFEENFILEHYQNLFSGMIVSVEEYMPDEYEVTSDPTVLRKIYPIPEEVADIYDI